MRKILINHLPQEVRVAFLEGDNLIRVIYERTRNRSPVHNIYKGKILKVLPGMECAFVNIGLPKASFLYVDDVRTDHFNEEDLDDEEAIDLEVEKNSEKSSGEENGKNEKSSESPPKVKIQDLLKEKSDILVQVVKSPIGTKGARISCNISIPGRNLVLTPYMKSVGVSRQISSSKERNRLKQVVSKNKPSNLGFIVRTVAQNRSNEEIINDIKYLVEEWAKIEQKFKRNNSPALLYGDLNLTSRILRDNMSDDVDELVIDSSEEFRKIKKHVDAYLPSYSQVPVLYNRQKNIFDFYGINAEIDKALGNKVFLPSGGYLVIDQTEALTSIDVNTGSFTGNANHEDTILKTNFEAIVELVRQIRIRDLGGIIIIDFIDMGLSKNRSAIYNALKLELKKDKAKTKILQISEIGLVEMTRKRNRENLDNFLRMPCPHCQGSGRIKSIETTVYDIYRDLFMLLKSKEQYKNILIGVHPDIYDFIEYNENKTISAMEKEYDVTFSFKPNINFYREQFEIFELA